MNNDIAGVVLLTKWRPLFTGEKLLTLKQRLQLAMAQRRQEERVRKAELNRLDNEDCGEEEEEAEMTDEDDEVAVFLVTLAAMWGGFFPLLRSDLTSGFLYHRVWKNCWEAMTKTRMASGCRVPEVFPPWH